jgi:hypothetical protein
MGMLMTLLANPPVPRTLWSLRIFGSLDPPPSPPPLSPPRTAATIILPHFSQQVKFPASLLEFPAFLSCFQPLFSSFPLFYLVSPFLSYFPLLFPPFFIMFPTFILVPPLRSYFPPFFSCFPLLFLSFLQYCKSGSVGSICFWASRIRIQIH